MRAQEPCTPGQGTANGKKIQRLSHCRELQHLAGRHDRRRGDGGTCSTNNGEEEERDGRSAGRNRVRGEDGPRAMTIADGNPFAAAHQ